jgi:glycosyltransferase involved in cell wall biosynthesis
VRVALDARRLQDPVRTGVGRGLANVLPHLVGAVEVVLLTDARRAAPVLDELEGSLEVAALTGPPGLPEPYWLQVSVARWLGHFDGIFHGTYNAIPFRLSVPSVVTIHDLAWLEHAEDLSRAKRASFATQARWSARRARAVLTVSRYSRTALIDAYGVSPDAVAVAPNAVDPLFSPERKSDLPVLGAQLGLVGDYVVAVGGARRRGVEVAMEAWRRLPDPRPQLVVVGEPDLRVDAGVVVAGHLDDAAWATLLAGALALCYPTRYEGFGMPGLEAIASGTPVVCARIGPLPEVLGEAAQWCPSPGVVDIAAGLAVVVGDDARRTQLIEAGLAQAAASATWADSAAVVLAAYTRAAG